MIYTVVNYNKIVDTVHIEELKKITIIYNSYVTIKKGRRKNNKFDVCVEFGTPKCLVS